MHSNLLADFCVLKSRDKVRVTIQYAAAIPIQINEMNGVSIWMGVER